MMYAQKRASGFQKQHASFINVLIFPTLGLFLPLLAEKSARKENFMPDKPSVLPEVKRVHAIFRVAFLF